MGINKEIILNDIEFSNTKKFVLLAGLNVLESESLADEVCGSLQNVTNSLDIPFIFKASFDKANRSSIHSFRGPGLDKGLDILSRLKSKYKVPIVADIHEPYQAEPASKVCDIVQIPAFLCRQTDLIVEACKYAKIINIKKMQMMSASEMNNIVQKMNQTNFENIMLCERGNTFGYNNLIVDPLNFSILKKTGYPVIFDVTHSLQMPGGLGEKTAGRGEYVYDLAKTGIASGISGLFIETHPDPKQAKCDGPCAIKLDKMPNFLKNIKKLDDLIKKDLAPI